MITKISNGDLKKSKYDLFYNRINNCWKSLHFSGNVPIGNSIIELKNKLRNTNNRGYALFGGCVRDWYLNRRPRDIDLVTWFDDPLFDNWLSQFITKDNLSINTFKGNVIELDGISFDIWNLPRTSFIMNGVFSLYWDTLVKMVPFNVSAIIAVYDGWTSTNPSYENRVAIYDNGFFKAMEDKIIDFVNPKHPDPYKVAHRAICLSERYGFDMSTKVKDYVNTYITKGQQKQIRSKAKSDNKYRLGQKGKMMKSSNINKKSSNVNTSTDNDLLKTMLNVPF